MIAAVGASALSRTPTWPTALSPLATTWAVDSRSVQAAPSALEAVDVLAAVERHRSTPIGRKPVPGHIEQMIVVFDELREEVVAGVPRRMEALRQGLGRRREAEQR